ncbi:hypothetical protein OG756_03005 [Streptomyces sp. NBC_01310]|uniref:hypothetical protein n=1 Tax=Streptomyces sp. NBC_01310 TaxID=2903820 RepID=UPI0035B5B966|nr:hypothetical protein OG756_03005 [Streptomyces sp. NBC_01310]
MTGPVTADRLKKRLEVVHKDRTFAIENLIGAPDEADARAQVERLRREHGFKLPAPDWEAADNDGMVILCRMDDSPVGSVRLIHRRADATEWCPYLTPELAAALPADPAGFAFCERLVISPDARSLASAAMVMYAASTWSAELWPVTEIAAITRPELVRLLAWLGFRRQLSDPMVLPGSDGLGLLIGGHLAEMARCTRELFSTAGWRLQRTGPLHDPYA